jgi:hypothetical protein
MVEAECGVTVTSLPYVQVPRSSTSRLTFAFLNTLGVSKDLHKAVSNGIPASTHVDEWGELGHLVNITPKKPIPFGFFASSIKMHGAEGVSSQDIAMLTTSLVGDDARVHVETEQWKGRIGSDHEGKSVHSIFMTSPTLLKRASWLLNVVGGKLWKDGADQAAESCIPDWVCQLPYLRTPKALESMSMEMGKIYVGGTGDADSMAMSSHLLELNGGILKEQGVEFFQIKSSDGSYRNFGFLCVLKPAVASIMGMAWPDMRGELMRMAPATENAPGAVLHGGRLERRYTGHRQRMHASWRAPQPRRDERYQIGRAHV